MIAAALALWRSRGLVGIVLAGIAFAAVGGYALWLRGDVAELEADKAAIAMDRDTWHAASVANEAAVAAIKAESARALAAVAADRDQALARLGKVSDYRKEVAHAAGTHEDGPPSGVLVLARDRLARMRRETPAGGDGDQGREGPPPGRASGLQR